MLLAKQTVGKAGLLCQQPCPAALPTTWTEAVGKASCWQSCRSLCQPDFANSSRFPVGEGNGSRADGAPLRQQYTWQLAKLSQQGPRSCWRRALSRHLKRQRFFPNRNSETLLGKPSPTV
jgi:hypothetical protein